MSDKSALEYMCRKRWGRKSPPGDRAVIVAFSRSLSLPPASPEHVTRRKDGRSRPVAWRQELKTPSTENCYIDRQMVTSVKRGKRSRGQKEKIQNAHDAGKASLRPRGRTNEASSSLIVIIIVVVERLATSDPVQ